MSSTTTNRIGALALLATFFLPAVSVAEPPEGENKKFYSLGVMVAQRLGGFYLTEEEVDAVLSGIEDSLLGRDTGSFDVAALGSELSQLQRQRAALAAQGEKTEAAAFVAAAEAEEGAEVTDSGLVIHHLTEGEGASPSATDVVTVHYHGTLRDGTVFDSSVDRGEPATFSLSQVIPCWTEGVQRIKVGGKARLVCPASIAYGDQGAPPKIPPGAALAFEVELISIGEPQ